jgi:hypothetical protein
MDLVRDSQLGVEFQIDPRFARVDPDRVPGVGRGHGEGGNGHGGNGHGGAESKEPGSAGGGGSPGAGARPALPTAHFVASDPAAGWIAALAIVTVATDAVPGGGWLERQLATARASFARWVAASHEMLVPPEGAELAGRPALHVRYCLTGAGEGAGEAALAAPDRPGPTPPTLVEHWTVLVGERSRLLVLELMVQPPERWEKERAAFGLPFSTLALV